MSQIKHYFPLLYKLKVSYKVVHPNQFPWLIPVDKISSLDKTKIRFQSQVLTRKLSPPDTHHENSDKTFPPNWLEESV